MKNDPRYCSACGKLLLKQDFFGYVLLRSCDSCEKIIHENCYLKHHQIEHDLIAVVIEEKEEIKEQFYFI